jgi:hypothetical protein
VESEDPTLTAQRLAAESGGAIASGLGEAARALAKAVDLVTRARDATLARQAVGLAKRLEPFDEDADARLLARRDELEAALALGPTVTDQLTDLHRRIGLLHFAEHRRAAADAALASQRERLGFQLPVDVDIVELRRARQTLHTAQVDLELAELRIEELATAVAELAASQGADDDGVARAASAARRASETDSMRSRLLVRRAVLLTLPVVALVAATAAGLVGGAVGIGLSVAAVPPIVELLRRGWTARAAGRRRIHDAEALARRAAQKQQRAFAAAQAEQFELEHRRAEAARARFAASAGWLQAAGPTVPEEHADAALEAASGLAELRQGAGAAARAADGLRQAFARELSQLGAPPELDPVDALYHVQRIADLRPVAADLLASVAEAEQRCIQREVLTSLVGSRDMAAVRRAARCRASVTLDPLVIVDDGDPVQGPVVASALRELAGGMVVTIVTERPDRWQSVMEDLAGRVPDVEVEASAGGEAFARFGSR